MKIGIDARLWSQTGIGRYIRNLVFNLLLIDKKNLYVLFVLKKEEEEIKNQIFKFKFKNSNLKIISLNIPWHSLREQLLFPGIIKKEKVDLMHFSYQESVPIFYKGLFVVTIHDLIPYHFMTGKASTLPIWLYGFKMIAYRAVINNATRKARKVIAVSKTTKEEIADHLVVNKANIEVVYEASDDFRVQAEVKIEVKNYFLYVGNVYPHKNTDKMMKAFKELAEKKDLKMVFIGKEDYFYKNLKKETKNLEKSGKVIFDFEATDKKLSGYYKNAICLVRPSLMEGFSLPPLEAMENDCLVIASDIPVHREILGDGIIYFNPEDYIDMESKMNYVLNLDKKSKEELIRKGKELTKKFSWKKTAQETLSIYESSTRL